MVSLIPSSPHHHRRASDHGQVVLDILRSQAAPPHVRFLDYGTLDRMLAERAGVLVIDTLQNDIARKFQRGAGGRRLRGAGRRSRPISNAPAFRCWWRLSDGARERERDKGPGAVVCAGAIVGVGAHWTRSHRQYGRRRPSRASRRLRARRTARDARRQCARGRTRLGWTRRVGPQRNSHRTGCDDRHGRRRDQRCRSRSDGRRCAGAADRAESESRRRNGSGLIANPMAAATY